MRFSKQYYASVSSNQYIWWAFRPSIKGTKRPFIVIKAIIINMGIASCYDPIERWHASIFKWHKLMLSSSLLSSAITRFFSNRTILFSYCPSTWHVSPMCLSAIPSLCLSPVFFAIVRAFWLKKESALSFWPRLEKLIERSVGPRTPERVRGARRATRWQDCIDPACSRLCWDCTGP